MARPSGIQEAKNIPSFLYLIFLKAALDRFLEQGPRGPELEHLLKTLGSSKPALATTCSQGSFRDNKWEEDELFGDLILLRSKTLLLSICKWQTNVSVPVLIAACGCFSHLFPLEQSSLCSPASGTVLFCLSSAYHWPLPPCPSQGQCSEPQALLQPQPEGEGEKGRVVTVVLECWGQVIAIVLIQTTPLAFEPVQ